MRVLFINLQSAGTRKGYSGLFIPFGLAYITAALKKHGYSSDCIDLQTEQILKEKTLDPVEAISRFDLTRYDIVAFGGTFLKFNDLKKISEKVWEHKRDIFQIAGGHMATAVSDIILKQTNVDCVCTYEGEETAVELLDCVRSGRDWRRTRGIKYLSGKGEVVQTPQREKIDSLDVIPFPERDDWSFNIIRKAFPYGSPGRYCAIMFASRGCPFSCIFCHPSSGKVIRTRSPENIVSEIKYLKEKWNVQYVRFFDEVFIGSKKKIKELCELILQEKLNIFWWCQTQIRLVDEELLRLMKKAGCVEIGYGIESGSNMILEEMRKGITKELSREVIEMTNRAGIKVSISIIAGTPSETLETIKETRDFIMSLNYIDWVQQVPSIGLIVPLPGTPLYDIAKEKGFIADEDRYITEEMFELGKLQKSINLTNMPDGDFFGFVKQCNEEIRKDYYLRHPWKKFLSIFGFDHLRWDLIFRYFSLRQIKPLFEAFIWATIAKRDNKVGRRFARLLYSR